MEQKEIAMQILAFLFFATVLGLTVELIRSMLSNASERIETALSGQVPVIEVEPAKVYVMRRRPALASATVPATAFRLAA
ncbi:hypothetical protein D5I55_10150 [Chakrabartia godavariana]|nr:hypothetical protein D5I55_10150 [Chakrabartia godavariana]